MSEVYTVDGCDKEFLDMVEPEQCPGCEQCEGVCDGPSCWCAPYTEDDENEKCEHCGQRCTSSKECAEIAGDCDPS